MIVKLDKVGKTKVACVELTGPYEAWGRGLMGLISVLHEMRVCISGLPVGLYHDNPV